LDQSGQDVRCEVSYALFVAIEMNSVCGVAAVFWGSFVFTSAANVVIY